MLTKKLQLLGNFRAQTLCYLPRHMETDQCKESALKIQTQLHNYCANIATRLIGQSQLESGYGYKHPSCKSPILLMLDATAFTKSLRFLVGSYLLKWQ